MSQQNQEQTQRNAEEDRKVRQYIAETQRRRSEPNPPIANFLPQGDVGQAIRERPPQATGRGGPSGDWTGRDAARTRIIEDLMKPRTLQGLGGAQTQVPGMDYEQARQRAELILNARKQESPPPRPFPASRGHAGGPLPGSPEPEFSAEEINAVLEEHPDWTDEQVRDALLAGQ